MAFQKISEPAAFSPGSELWIIPDAQHSNWTQKLDWYLNFQLLRAERHHSALISEEFKELLKEQQLEPPTATDESQKPLMLASQHQLPVNQAVSVPYGGNLKEWVDAVAAVWTGLKRPPLRLFLPKGLTSAQVSGLWPPVKENIDIGFVADRGTPE